MSSNFLQYSTSVSLRDFLNSCQRMAGSIEMTKILKLCGTERSCLLHGEVLNKALKSGIIHGFRSCKALYTYLTSLVFFSL